MGVIHKSHFEGGSARIAKDKVELIRISFNFMALLSESAKEGKVDDS